VWCRPPTVAVRRPLLRIDTETERSRGVVFGSSDLNRSPAACVGVVAGTGLPLHGGGIRRGIGVGAAGFGSGRGFGAAVLAVPSGRGRALRTAGAWRERGGNDLRLPSQRPSLA